jgi:hypothetical protein
MAFDGMILSTLVSKDLQQGATSGSWSTENNCRPKIRYEPNLARFIG